MRRRLSTSNLDRSHWRTLSLERDRPLKGRAVRRTYSKRTGQAFEVLQLDQSLSALDPMDVDQTTFKEFYLKKYGIALEHPQDPLLEVRPTSLHLNYRNKANAVAKKKKKDGGENRMYLMPELSEIHSLPCPVLQSASVLPTVLATLFQWQQAAELLRLLATKLGHQLAHINFQRTASTPSCSAKPLGSLRSLAAPDPARFPKVETIFRALSTKVAMYDYDLERLELLGDRFLKVSLSTYLFCDPARKREGEGVLSHRRMQAVCNESLYYLSRRSGLAAYLFRKSFDPKETWLPPMFAILPPCADVGEPSRKMARNSSDEESESESRSVDDSERMHASLVFFRFQCQFFLLNVVCTCFLSFFLFYF